MRDSSKIPPPPRGVCTKTTAVTLAAIPGLTNARKAKKNKDIAQKEGGKMRNLIDCHRDEERRKTTRRLVEEDEGSKQTAVLTTPPHPSFVSLFWLTLIDFSPLSVSLSVLFEGHDGSDARERGVFGIVVVVHSNNVFAHHGCIQGKSQVLDLSFFSFPLFFTTDVHIEY